MRLSDIEIEVLDVIASEANGISFNVLARRLVGKVSRVTLVKILRKLVSLGLIVKDRDDRHSQKVIYKAIERLRNVYVELSPPKIGSSDILSGFKLLIDSYERLISRGMDNIVKSYAIHRLLKSTRRLIEGVAYGENTLDSR